MKSVLPVVLFLAALGTAAAQTQTSFLVPLYFSAGPEKDTLHFGVNPGNTVGIDDAASFGSYRESMAPPTPPPPFAFDTRFISLPGRVSTYPTGLGTGAFRDVRGYKSNDQVDSFRVRIDGDQTDNGDVIVSWPSNLKDYATKWTIKPQTGSDWPATDMLTTTSVTIPAGAQKNIIIIKTGAFVTETERAADPQVFDLAQNFPNPVHAVTQISFTLPAQQFATLDVYNLLGARVARVTAREFAAGTHTIRFDASRLPAGIYLYRLDSQGASVVRRLHVTR
ncbi:MAG: T9SS type A sorting domain-containing protein [Ignavibacteriae bacterium]|nr:T9SS type A sorting domain-containing protein [Ignavibacteriota bacterium]